MTTYSGVSPDTFVQAQDWATFERLRRQAQFLLQARRYKETIDLALKAIALFPEDPRPYALVAYAMARQKRPEAPEWALKARSEEHTSELQSRGHLVCRL